MPQVRNKSTGFEFSVLEGHFSLSSSEYEILISELEKPLEQMNKADLLEKAKTLSVDVPEGSTKAQIIALIGGV